VGLGQAYAGMLSGQGREEGGGREGEEGGVEGQGFWSEAIFIALLRQIAGIGIS